MTRLYLAALAFLAIIIASLLGVRYAAAQERQCAPRADVVAGLARNYAETPVAMGIAANGHLLELFAAATGTWTLVGTDPTTGITCMIAAGAAFQAVPQGVMG